MDEHTVENIKDIAEIKAEQKILTVGFNGFSIRIEKCEKTIKWLCVAIGLQWITSQLTPETLSMILDKAVIILAKLPAILDVVKAINGA